MLRTRSASASPNWSSRSVTKSQLTSLLSQSVSAGLANPSPAGTPSSFANSTLIGATASSTPDTPPVIHINGDNPAIIQVCASYTDLGATITGPQADLNLGIHTLVGSTPMDQAVIDISAPATYHINYVVTDQNGLSATSTRTVIIEAASSTTPVSSTSSSSNPPSDSTATSTTPTPASNATTTKATSTQ
jgi:hypothetical protein